jgi:hypothetical protein
VVRGKMALDVSPVRPMEVREAVPKALAGAGRYNEESDELP